MNILIFSHIADCDGITPIILSKLCFNNVDYKLLDNPIDKDFLEYVNNNDFSKYDYIYMTDLCVSEETIKQLDDSFLSKFKIFDHHIGNIDMNKYDFIQVIDEENGIKQSGTSLYYNYLINNFNNGLLNKNSTKMLVDLVRQGDTWTFKDNDAVYIADYLALVGIEEYINYFINFIKNNDEFYFEDKLKFLFEVEDRKRKLYIEEKEQQIIDIYIKPYNIGVVFAESYRSSLGNALATKYIDKYDFIIVINVSRSISYRGVKDINLSDFASIYGGKGHKLAAGSPLPIKLRENIIKLIFNDVVIKEDKNAN